MIEQAILKTLAYRDVFDFPLTAGEIHKFLIEEKAPSSAVDENLPRLVSDGKVENEDGYYFLPGRREVAALRRQREKISQDKLEKTRRYADLFRPLPWVKAVFASGAVAVENADEGSDLDILIVTAPRRLWLSRFWIFSVLKLLRAKRPYDGSSISDKVCPNILLAETALAVPKNERNLYTAHEVVNLKPLWDRSGIHRWFLAENGWVRDFLPNWEVGDRDNDTPIHRYTEEGKRDQNLLVSLYPRIAISPLDSLEDLAYRLQLRYMERRQTREVTTPERIFFHPIDKTEQVLTVYRERLVALSLNQD